MNDPLTPPAPPAAASTCLWLVRHAEVEERYQGVFGGRIDMDLSPRGHEQAAALAAYLHERLPPALYASPMKRVQQTLSPLLNNGGPKPLLMTDLREVDFGVWTGLRWQDVQKAFGISPFAWLEQLDRDAIPEAESARALRARLEPCLRLILARHAGQDVMIACHGGVIRMLLAILLNWPLTSFAAVEIDYASITQVLCGGGEAKLLLANFAPWRELAGARPQAAR